MELRDLAAKMTLSFLNSALGRNWNVKGNSRVPHRISVLDCKEAILRIFPVVKDIYAFNRARRGRFVERCANLARPGNVVLDVGAGSAPHRRLFSHCSYIAADLGRLTPEQLEGRSGYSHLSCLCDSSALPIASASVDFVLCTEVLEHVPSPLDVVAEISRVLKGGGTLVLSAPMRSGVHQAPFHFFGGFSHFWYRRFLPAAGLEILELEPVCGLFLAFSEEALRVGWYLSPMGPGSRWFRLAALPLWLVLAPFLVGALPLAMYTLDRLWPINDFATGWLVKASRKTTRGGTKPKSSDSLAN